jgi:hypothetical protein
MRETAREVLKNENEWDWMAGQWVGVKCQISPVK